MKLLKNTTISDIFITDTGTNLPASSTYEIDPTNYPIWAASSDVLPEIDAGNLVGNDGVLDLSALLTKFMLQSDVAVHVGFNNATNGFVSTNVQAAIEEIRTAGHFSYRRILASKRVTIPEDEQMTVYQDFKIDSGGEIVIYGEIVIRP